MKNALPLGMAAVAALIIAACGGDTVAGPDGSPLAGLSKSTSNDTSNTTHTPTGTGPGYVRGTVIGQSAPGAGNDSLSTAPRISGVVITIYEAKAATGGAAEPGDAKGSVTTGADGKFTLPTLPFGNYIVTFVPPSSAGYNGVYVTGEIRQTSSEYPWWIVLQKK